MKFNESIGLGNLIHKNEEDLVIFFDAINIILFLFNFLFVGALIYRIWQLIIDFAEYVYEKELFSSKRIHFTNLSD
ncbi:hypothetical protein DERP_006219 [Dermatophagoides pteronyssinus]|uniref:Uncharacterized protein n=1 Tax=Dermatophagoides pteronyssinus TaxID=6956 RepID=A0ABQ8IXU8_DERPT|nr:hypothetical protein DERP_006219 [Dermatophagoides pteronyssinus]